MEVLYYHYGFRKVRAEANQPLRFLGSRYGSPLIWLSAFLCASASLLPAEQSEEDREAEILHVLRSITRASLKTSQVGNIYRPGEDVKISGKVWIAPVATRHLIWSDGYPAPSRELPPPKPGEEATGIEEKELTIGERDHLQVFGKLSFEVSVTVRITDTYGALHFDETRETKIGDGADFEASYSFAPPRHGLYYVNCFVRRGRETVRIVSTTVGAVPEPPELKKEPDSPFGIILGDLRNEVDLETALSLYERIGIRWAEWAGAFYWGENEPEKGHFVWNGDRLIDVLRKHCILAEGHIHQPVPRWAQFPENLERYKFDRSWNGLWCCPPKDLAGWAGYIEAVVTRYKDVVREWQFLHEVDCSYAWHGHMANPEYLAKVLITAADAAKRADPTCKVHPGSFVLYYSYLNSNGDPSHPTLENYLRYGVLDHFDYVNFHGCGRGLETLIFHYGMKDWNSGDTILNSG